MKAKELFDAGDLSGALDELNREVKSHPADARLRTFLFEVLCFSGDYPRARRQLGVIGHQSVSAEAGVQAYEGLMAAEDRRQKLLSEGLRPDFPLPEPPYAHLHIEAVERIRGGRPAEARSLLDESERTRPRVGGRADGQPFGEVRDADDLLGPFLEVFFQGRYAWLPFEQVARVRIPAPKRLRDLIWVEATVETRGGPAGQVFLPVLYAGSSEHADDRVRLGRMTDWKALGEDLALGAGQRLFLVDGEERAMLGVREIEIEAGGSGGG